MRFDKKNLEKYQVMPTYFLEDKRLSLKAMGMMAKIYSLPNNWEYSMNGLETILKDGITSIRSALAELELTGYLIRFETRNEKGEYEYIYKVFAKPAKINPNKTLTIRRFKASHRV